MRTRTPMVVKRALAAFTDETTGMPMTDIDRVFVWVLKTWSHEWDDMEGSLFHTGLGVYAYYPSESENDTVESVCFRSDGTAEGDILVTPSVQKAR